MFHRIFLGFCLLGFATGLVCLGRALVSVARAGGRWRPWSQGLMLLGVGTAALCSIRAYLSDNLVGAADSYFYGLQVADFITQARQGVMPVLIGQSDYAFNGNGHTVRTAPYFTHLAGLLDLLTLRRLSFVEVQNLAVAVTALLAAIAAYLGCLVVSGGRRTASALLATLYVLSPAIMGPLALRDMFATYMTIPWLVAVWAGLVAVLKRDSGLASQLAAAGALAVTWYAHPPVAAWLSLAWLLAQMIRAAHTDLRHVAHVGAALLVLGGLAGYAFVSGGSVGTGRFIAGNPPDFSFTPERLEQAVRSGFCPFLFAHESAGLQLGWALWSVLMVALIAGLRRRSTAGLTVLGLLALTLVLLFPLPFVSGPLWRLLPDRLVEMTTWPEQRLYPLLASGTVIACAAGLADLANRRAYRSVCGLLALGCIWSLLEAGAINRRAGRDSLPPEVHAVSYAPENLVLTRYSYTLTPQLPASFTHGWMDPEFETRLLDHNLDPLTDNARHLLQSGCQPVMTPIGDRLVIDLEGPGGHLIVFSFLHLEAEGEITIRGAGVSRNYWLPRSGELEAFGSLPSCTKTIPLLLKRPGRHQITIGCSVPDARVGIMSFDCASLPLRVSGQTPLTIKVRSPAAAFLETPRVFLEGYAATVNGQPVSVRRSPNHLVMIPVPADQSEVVLTYPGTPLLRASWAISLAEFALFPWLLLGATACAGAPWARYRALESWLTQHGRAGPMRRRVAVLLASVGVMICAGLWLAPRISHGPRAQGPLRLRLELPKRPAARAEPLLTLGKTGAADCVYVIYEDEHHVRVGYDHWGHGGPVSPPIPVTYGDHHSLEITLGGLQLPPSSATGGSSAAGSQLAPFELKWNGITVLAGDLPFHRSAPHELAIGRNHAGNSVASAVFSGRILAQERRDTADAATGPGP